MSTPTKTKRGRPRDNSSKQTNNKNRSKKLNSKKTRNPSNKKKHHNKRNSNYVRNKSRTKQYTRNDFSDYYSSNESSDYSQSSYYTTETPTDYTSHTSNEYNSSSHSSYDSTSNSSHQKKQRKQKRGTKRKKFTETNESLTNNDNNIIPPLPSPPLASLPIGSLPKEIFTVIPIMDGMDNENIINNVNIPPMDMPMPMPMLVIPKLGETNDKKHVQHNKKKSRHKYNQSKKRHMNDSIGISKRMRNHINAKSFEYYMQMPKEWYNPMECIIGIETGRILNGNQQRLNYAYNVVNELLTDTIINNNIIEYKQNDCENINKNENEMYWKSLLDCLKTDGETLEHIYNKMMSEMVLKQKSESINTLKGYHKPLVNEQFNDLIMNHKEYNLCKQRLHDKSWIGDTLMEHEMENELDYIEMLKKGPNPNQRCNEREYEVKTYYKCNKKEKGNGNMEQENEIELQTESDMDENDKRCDLDVNYNVKYEYIEDLNDIFDINKLTNGLPNGLELMNIAKEYEQKYDDFYIGKRTLMGLPVNDSVYPLIMTDLINKYYEENNGNSEENEVEDNVSDMGVDYPQHSSSIMDVD